MRVYVKEIVKGHPLWDGRNTGKYTAECEGLHIVARCPFLEMARKLIELDVYPQTVLEMWREGDASWSLRSTIEKAARLTVREGEKTGPTWEAYKPFSLSAVLRPAAESEI
jgi:hypothetical protein